MDIYWNGHFTVGDLIFGYAVKIYLYSHDSPTDLWLLSSKVFRSFFEFKNVTVVDAAPSHGTNVYRNLLISKVNAPNKRITFRWIVHYTKFRFQLFSCRNSCTIVTNEVTILNSYFLFITFIENTSWNACGWDVRWVGLVNRSWTFQSLVCNEYCNILNEPQLPPWHVHGKYL